jgi:protein CsiD
MYHAYKRGFFREGHMIATSTAVRERFRIAAHPHHDRLHHVALSDGYLRAFFQSVENVNVQTLEHTPYMRFILAQRLDDLLGTGFKKAIRGITRDRHSGGFTIGVQGITIRRDDYLKLATAIGHLLGPASNDALSGVYYERHAVKDVDENDAYRRQAYRSFSLHTDGAFVDEPTDWLLMMKFEEKNAIGGTCRLLHVDDWEDLRLYSQHPMGSRELTYKAPPNKYGICSPVKRKTFYQSVDGLSMCFIDQFAYPENMEQAAYLKEMSDSLERSPWTTAVPIPVGDMLLLNNHFWLHGRSAFQRHQELFREVLRQRGTFSA